MGMDQLPIERTIDYRADRIHETAAEHGFWEGDQKSIPQKIALMHSELSEALEEYRDGKPLLYFACQACGYESDQFDVVVAHHGVPNSTMSWWQKAWRWVPKRECEGDRNPKPEGALIEFIDCNIRVYDTLVWLLKDDEDLTIEDLYDIKMRFNAGRGFMHGRKF